MEFDKDKYIERLIDKNIDDYLDTFGAVLLEGPKWCGKTWTSSRHAKTIKYLDNEETKAQAELD